MLLKAGREEGAAVIRVSDDGVGIPTEMLESIFELFVQSTRTLDRAAGGLGVGLTLVRVARGRCTAGWSRLPAKGTGRAASSWCGCRSRPSFRSVTPRRPNRVRVRASERGAKVVVVEDNADSRELLCELLAQEGFECATAESGPAALELIDRIRPAIAILDVGLPEMDGFEVARRLRSTTGARRHVPDRADRLRSGERPGRGARGRASTSTS